VAISVGIWGTGAYFIEHQIIDALIKPAHGQQFIYTSPVDGINFLFKVCIYAGLIASIPVIVYNFLRYVEPLMAKDSARFIAVGSIISGILAAVGIAFGYFMGLPAALHFLLHQFITDQVTPMLTIQSYMSFVVVYMVGSALLFQLPLIMLFINRIRPLKPSTLFHYERWVILIAFIMAGLMNPTPRVLDQLLVAGPIILMYQVGIVIIALLNRPRRPGRVRKLASQDAAKQAARQERLQSMKMAWKEASAIADNPPILLTHPVKSVMAPPSPKPKKLVPVPAVAPALAPAPKVEPETEAPAHVSRPPREAYRSQKYLNSYIDDRRPKMAYLSNPIDITRPYRP
jgi:sec-independent protein translocase protein TatC